MERNNLIFGCIIKTHILCCNENKIIINFVEKSYYYYNYKNLIEIEKVCKIIKIFENILLWELYALIICSISNPVYSFTTSFALNLKVFENWKHLLSLL